MNSSVALLAAAVLAGCTAGPAAVGGNVTVPAPAPVVAAAPPSGTPAPVPTSAPSCNGIPVADSVPALSAMPAPGHMPANSTMAAIERRGYLLAGVDQDEYRWSSPNPSPAPPPGEEFFGFDIDLLHALAYAIFGNPNAIRFVPVTQDFRMGAANEGLVDVVADSITITCARKEKVRFSIDYFDSGQELLVPRDVGSISVAIGPGRIADVKGLGGKKVCTVGSTTSAAYLRALAKKDGFSVVLALNWSDCLVLLQQGAVQAFSTTNSILGGIAAEDPYLKLVGKPFSFEPHGLAFPLADKYSTDNSQFVSFANGVIENLEADKHARFCPRKQLPQDTTCWDALYRYWVEAGLSPGTAPAPPTPMFSG
jgi:polar amino acid transport system substrate-binding protein